MSKVCHYLLQGWPTIELDKELKPLKSRKNEISSYLGWLHSVWGAQVVVPPPEHKAVLEELHETHLGVNKMNALARRFTWWPRMDKDIEDVAKRHPSCQQINSSPLRAPSHSWEWPSQQWSRLHLDFADYLWDTCTWS